MWKTETPKPKSPVSSMHAGPFDLSIQDSEDNHQFQYALLSFGVRSTKSREECLKTWPREAIRIAREHLDRFEARLEEGV